MKIKLGVLLIALLSTMVMAQDAPPPGPGGPPAVAGHRPHFMWWKNSDTVSKLNLTNDQVTQLDQTFNQHKTNLKTDMKEMWQADRNLRTLLDQDNPDQNQVTNAANAVLAARANVERETTMMMLDFRKILTAQQWKELRQMHPMGPGFGGHMRGHFRGRGFRGPGGPPPASPDGSQPTTPPQD